MQDNKYVSIVKEVDRILKNTGEDTTNKEYEFVIKEVDKLFGKFDESDKKIKEKKRLNLESRKVKIEDDQKKRDTKKLKTHFSINQPPIRSEIVGLILIVGGIVFLFNPTILNIKIGVTAILIGILLFFFITEKSTSKSIDVKITTFIILWVMVMFFTTGSVSLDTFFILIVLGTLITRELTDEFLTVHLKKRMALLISMFLMIYIVFIVEKIISFLNI